MDNIPDDAPSPRLCHLVKWADFDGYGFNLHGEKSKPGQYIGKVDKDSPAEVAGLKNNDRIIEVNGTNISNENHKQVVQRIKAIPNETKLLVLDEKAEEYYKSKNIVVTGTMANVKYAKTPSTRSGSISMEIVNGDSMGEVVDNHHHDPVVVVASNGGVHHHHRNNSDEDRASHASDSGSSLASKNNSLDKYRNGGIRNEEDVSSTGPSPTPTGSSASPSPTPLSNVDSSLSNKSSNSSLDLNMTVQEMRAKLAARKKVDAKSQKIDLRKKYDIIQTL